MTEKSQNNKIHQEGLRKNYENSKKLNEAVRPTQPKLMNPPVPRPRPKSEG